jgi:hypothetical protein
VIVVSLWWWCFCDGGVAGRLVFLAEQIHT